jgi:hypothetical protein
MQASPSYIYSTYQKCICPRCEFFLNSTHHVPIVAPCGHTFCDKCIEEEYLEKRKFRCDLCKMETTEHFSKFPTNFYILNIRKNKVKNESIFKGGKSPKINRNNNILNYSKTNSSNISITYSYGGSLQKKETNYSINNELTYTFFNNKLDIIKRDVEFEKKTPDIKTDCPSDFSNKKISQRYRRISTDILQSQNDNKNLSNLIKNEEEKENIEKKSIKIIDFYGDGIEKKKKYPPLYNYFELLKKLFKYGDKYNKKYFNQIFMFVFRFFMILILLITNIYFIKYIDVAFFYLFVCILVEKENTIYEISTKIKMFLALSCFYFVENIVKSLGFKYLIEISSYISNISSGTRTLYNILVLGNDSTLNLVVFTILNILSNLHLLLN